MDEGDFQLTQGHAFAAQIVVILTAKGIGGLSQVETRHGKSV